MLLFPALALISTTSRADTVASLLGNFSVSQYSELSLASGNIGVRHAIVFGQLPALRELHLADTNGDGVTSQLERDLYAQRLAETLASQLVVTVDGVGVPLHVERATTSLPTEQSGFSLRIEIHFTIDLPPPLGHMRRVLSFTNESYLGRFGWQEIVVKPSRSIAVFDTDAYSTSLTTGLTESVQAMPESGPLAERSVTLNFVAGPLPAGGRPLGPRPGTTGANGAAADTGSTVATSWVSRQTRRIVELVSAPNVPTPIALLALAAAFVLGAFHALSPGHGKTVVGAYLIGSRGTPAHAVFLGATVTITHTLGVFALGLVTLVASSFIVPERLLPLLSFGSGILVLAIGVSLLVARMRTAKNATRPQYRPLAPAAAKASTAPWRVATGRAHTLAFAHVRTHDGRVHAGRHKHDRRHHDHSDGALVHSHGGVVHSHLPPGADGAKVTWKSLVALGISGGLVPCPSAMVLLLAAIAANKTAYGMLLVLTFSVGLAGTLTAVGLAFLHARDRLGAARVDPRWRRWLPVASAAAITAVGVAMCYGAIVSAPF